MHRWELRMNFYTVGRNTKALKKNTSDTTDGQIIFTKNVGVGAASHKNAPIWIRAPYYSSSAARAMIGFDNQGSNTGILWLDVDGRLKFTDDNNRTKIISWSDAP